MAENFEDLEMKLKLEPPLNLGEFEEMVEIVAGAVNCRVNYDSAVGRLVDGERNQEVSTDVSRIKISGSIFRMYSPEMPNIPFCCETDLQEPPNIISIDMIPIPGYGPRDYERGVIQLWSEFKDKAREYLSTRSKPAKTS